MKKLTLVFVPILLAIVVFIVSTNNSAAQVAPTTINGCATISRNLFFGMRGNDVSTLQQFLKDKGYFYGNVTGNYGWMTWNAVAKFQMSQGIRAVGAVGPLTRNKIVQICGGTGGGTTPPPYDDNIPVYNFQPSANCSSWNDGCNDCSRSAPGAPAACTLRYCFAAGKGYCKTHFDSNTNNRPPVITSFSGPTTISQNQTGTWTIIANDRENQQLTYSISWGDNQTGQPQSSNALSPTYSFSQTTTFTHTYSTPGTYTVAVTVTDPSGQTARTTTTVQVGGGQVYCTMEYNPVCGQPPEPPCRYSNPPCLLPTPAPKTYSNRCVMNSEGATFLYAGQCNNGN